METHAQELHKTPGHGWKHYFFEFFMLFLAVSLGFFVENLRERYAEYEREQQYVRTMVEDLRSDTAQLKRLMSVRKDRVLRLDTLFELISSDRYIKEPKTLYGLFEWPHWDILRFFPSDRTMQQLKNAGNLRLIRNQQVSDALIGYDVYVRNRKEYEPLQVDLANQMNEYVEKLIDPVILFHLTGRDIAQQLSSDTVIRGQDKIVLPDEFRVTPMDAGTKKIILKYIGQVKILFSELRRDNIRELGRAVNTLNLIKREYHLGGD
ncbi:MAG TPA: hypothetical protein VKR32_08650 [Puia sp.]|nr:hypothetical protein [Puia sp.]